MELDADVIERVEEYVAQFAADFGIVTRRHWAEVYLQGLLLDGERKTIQPLSQRVSVRAGTVTPSRRCSCSSIRAAGTSRRSCARIGGCWQRRWLIRLE